MSNERRDFDDWFGQSYRRVLGSVLIVCAGDMPRAEDATNDAFIDALEDWDRVANMDSPKAWVTKVAINKAKRSWLRRKRYINAVNVETLDLPMFDDASKLELWNAVNKLSVKQRKAIVMRYVDDMTQSDIASELGVAPGTVSATLTQARGNLRVELEGEAV